MGPERTGVNSVTSPKWEPTFKGTWWATTAKPAMLFFVKGEATVGLGDGVQEAQAGTWVHMPAGLKHSIKAKTPVVMLLVLLK